MHIPWDLLGLDRFVLVDPEGTRYTCVHGERRYDIDGDAEGFPRVCFGPVPEQDARTAHSIDGALLARALFPTVADHTSLSASDRGRVEDRTVDSFSRTMDLFACLLEEAMQLDREIVGLLSQFSFGLLSALLGKILLIPRATRDEGDTEGGVAWVCGSQQDICSVDDALGPDGWIAQALSTYESRSGQLDMARKVARVLDRGGTLTVEAGPGTGKTFAYLIPLLLHLEAHPGVRAVVCTRTKQLQEQLFVKDLPFLTGRMAPSVKTALLKGRENYLCLRRWDLLATDAANGLETVRQEALLPLVRWLYETQTGDIEENTAFLSSPEAGTLWPRLADSPLHCVGAFCPHIEECHSVRARRRARKADLVVVNHALLLGDAEIGGAVLGKYQALIVDEAHTLETAARRAFTRSLSRSIVGHMTDEIAPLRNRRSGWLYRSGVAPEEDLVRRTEEACGRVRTCAANLFLALEKVVGTERRGTVTGLGEVDPEFERLRDALSGLELQLEMLVEHAGDDPERIREGEAVVDAVRVVGSVVRTLRAGAEDNAVHWHDRQGEQLWLHVTPLDIASMLQVRLYRRLDSLVLTSATLSYGDEFAYVRRSLGLEDAVSPSEWAVVESPFAYEERMRILVPGDFPSVRTSKDAYAEAIARLLETLHLQLRRNGLVLFTSYDLLHRVRERIGRRVPVLAQGVDGPRSKLVERFRMQRDGMLLLGTDSFWEGIDLPGKDLEYLVVTRLPFAVPSDPVLLALSDRLAAKGRDPFKELAVPHAVLRLRQGVGRLIRAQGDRGVVIVTDGRLLSHGYGASFARAMPVRVEEMSCTEHLVAAAVSWFETATEGRLGA